MHLHLIISIMMDEGCEAIDRGDLSEFYSTVEGRRAKETQTQYAQVIKRLRKLLELNESTKLSDVDPKELLKIIHKDSFHSDGRMKTKASPEKFRNSLVNYYNKRKLDIPSEIDVDLAQFIKGRGAEVATAKMNGELKATEGKDVLEYSTYKAIARASMEDDYIDGHLFFLMLWNMSCRGDTTHNMHLSHIHWRNDSLLIHIPKSKNHQRGAERGEEHKFSVYANPLNPEACVLLALGIKLLTTSIVQENAPLYRPTEKDHFARWLEKQVELHEREQSELQPRSDLGVQSVRKGSLTYSLAFPGAASTISTLLRAGYLLGGVLPRYVALAIEGDCNVSRILCGLPAQSEDLSLLPPRFAPNQNINWSEMVCDIDSYPTAFQSCIPYLIASVVYHAEWLKKTLPRTHSLFQSRFWRSNQHNLLQASVLPPVRMHCSATGMRATGVSPLTVVLDRIASLPTQSSHSPPLATSVVEPTPAVLAPLVAQLNGLSQMMTQLTAVVGTLVPQQHAPVQAGTAPVPMQLQQAVTQDFPWPIHVALRQLYMLWYEGVLWKGRLYPLRDVCAKHLHKGVRKYVSYAKACVAVIDDHLPPVFRYQDVQEQDRLFKIACKQLVLQLIACGNESTEEALMVKIISNDYSSLYMNDLRVLRTKSS